MSINVMVDPACVVIGIQGLDLAGQSVDEVVYQRMPVLELNDVSAQNDPSSRMMTIPASLAHHRIRYQVG